MAIFSIAIVTNCQRVLLKIFQICGSFSPKSLSFFGHGTQPRLMNPARPMSMTFRSRPQDAPSGGPPGAQMTWIMSVGKRLKVYACMFLFWLVVWNMICFSIHIGNVMIPTDESSYFSEGFCQPPTSYDYPHFFTLFQVQIS